jgi:hypothetical protein
MLDPVPKLSPSDSILALPACHEPVFPLDAARALEEKGYYCEHYTKLLSLMLAAQVEEREKAVLHCVPLQLDPSAQAPRGRYRLQIPGIREDSPLLNVGDILTLRGLFVGTQTAMDVEIEVEVSGMLKAKGWVYVYSPELEAVNSWIPQTTINLPSGASSGLQKVEGAMYQVRFKVSAGQICTMQDAVSELCF